MDPDSTPLLISSPTTVNKDNPPRPPSPVEDVPPSPPSLDTLDALDTAKQFSFNSHRRRTTTFSEAPPYLQQNEHILSGYRQELGSWGECVKSVGWVHNELANIHTHLLPAVFFLLLLSAVSLSLLATTVAPRALVYRLPLFLPFPTEESPSVTWLDTSVFACLFGGASVCSRARRFDHFGILFHTSVRFIAAFHYGFHPDPHLRDVYILLMLLACAGGVYVIVLSNDLQAYEYRRHRTACFVAVGAVAAVPFGHAILRYGFEAASERMAFTWIGIEVACLVAGTIIYSERFPECLFSGQFDLIARRDEIQGNSHNLFHLLAVAAVFAQWQGAVEGYTVVHGIAIMGDRGSKALA
ncbi:hypothetical protein JCM11251_006711 [Rhodosporidiobolus azoricus]